jgi:hypothetical protein
MGGGLRKQSVMFWMGEQRTRVGGATSMGMLRRDKPVTLVLPWYCPATGRAAGTAYPSPCPVMPHVTVQGLSCSLGHSQGGFLPALPGRLLTHPADVWLQVLASQIYRLTQPIQVGGIVGVHLHSGINDGDQLHALGSQLVRKALRVERKQVRLGWPAGMLDGRWDEGWLGGSRRARWQTAISGQEAAVQQLAAVTRTCTPAWGKVLQSKVKRR